MASKSETMDVESLQKSARRGRCLDCCLVLSVIVLFAGLAALAAAGVMVVHNLQSKLQQRAHPEFQMSKVIGSAPDNMFKMQNFAYLEATSSELKNHTMPLMPVSFRDLKSVGSNYVFNPVQHSLQVKKTGSYFVYVELNVSCVGGCQSPGESLLRVQVSDKLRCDVHLHPPPSPQPSPQPQQRKCWTVMTLIENTSLLSQMSLPHGLLSPWKLELRGSGVGVFLVD